MRHPGTDTPSRPRRASWALALALCAAAARAGDFHDGTTLNCSDCHVVHLSSLPGAERADGDLGRVLEALGPQAAALVDGELLKPDVNELCLSCHDDNARAPDVVGHDLGSQAGRVRQAGSLNRLGLGSTSTGHTLGSLDDAPGSNPPWRPEDENGAGGGLNCLNCHAHHGRLQTGADTYRNLRPDAGRHGPGGAPVTYNHDTPGANNLARDVFVRRTRDYDEAAVDFNEPNARDSAMGRWCAGCHDQLHGAPGSTNMGGRTLDRGYVAFLRHPTAGVDIGGVGGEWSSLRVFGSRRNRVKVMSSTGQWDPPAPDATPTCISCHKAHGNNNAFGLVYRSGEGRLSEDGDGGGEGLQSLCGQCHVQGTPFDD